MFFRISSAAFSTSGVTTVSGWVGLKVSIASSVIVFFGGRRVCSVTTVLTVSLIVVVVVYGVGRITVMGMVVIVVVRSFTTVD